jgi:hypothetical protein
MKERPVSATLESFDPEDQSLLRMTKRVMRIPTLSPPWSLQGESLPQILRKPKPCRNLETLFQPVPDPSVPAIIEMVDEGLRSLFIAPASEPTLTNPEEVQKAIMGLNVSKAPGPNGIPNRDLKHLPQRAVSLLVLIFNAILLTHHFPTAGKHT